MRQGKIRLSNYRIILSNYFFKLENHKLLEFYQVNQELMREIEKPLINVVTPLWNQEELLPEIARRLGAVFENVSIEWQWFAVDDDSSDHTAELVTNLHRKFLNAKFIKFSRNFGQQGAFLRSSSSACHVAGVALVS